MMGGRKQRNDGVVMTVVDLVVGVITCLAVAALILAYFAPYVNPNNVYWFAFLGLVAPFIYIGNLFLMLYWVLRWRRIALLVAVVLIAGVGNISKFYRPELKRHYDEQTVRLSGSLRVLSYNVAGFLEDDNGTYVNRSLQITKYIREVNPDVICFQEFEVNASYPINKINENLESWPHKTVAYRLGGNPGETYGWGLAIYSKYPIIFKNNMAFPNSTNSALWADIVVNRDTIRVYNAHLQTTQINEKDREFIGYEALTDSLRNDKAMGIARKLKRNFAIRADQADSLATIVHSARSKAIVCGDFNDTPMSYIYQTMRGDFVDTFKRKGCGSVFTYKGLFSLFRIDYIFHSKNFKTLSYETSTHSWSDHNPVVVDILPKNE